MSSGVASAISGGGGELFIYSCSAQLISFEIESTSKEINCAKHECMNMSPSLRRPLLMETPLLMRLSVLLRLKLSRGYSKLILYTSLVANRVNYNNLVCSFLVNNVI